MSSRLGAPDGASLSSSEVCAAQPVSSAKTSTRRVWQLVEWPDGTRTITHCEWVELEEGQRRHRRLNLSFETYPVRKVRIPREFVQACALADQTWSLAKDLFAICLQEARRGHHTTELREQLRLRAAYLAPRGMADEIAALPDRQADDAGTALVRSAIGAIDSLVATCRLIRVIVRQATALRAGWPAQQERS